MFEDIERRVVEASPLVVMAMARRFRERVRDVELIRFQHAPGTRTTSPPGSPPAKMTGRLRDSVQAWPGVAGVVSAAYVAPFQFYAGVQEYGDEMVPTHFHYMHWYTDGVPYWKKHVTVPARPYMRPAIKAAIANGSLSRAAVKAFMAKVWP